MNLPCLDLSAIVHNLGLLTPLYRQFRGVMLPGDFFAKKLMSSNPNISFLRGDMIRYANLQLLRIPILFTTYQVFYYNGILIFY